MSWLEQQQDMKWAGYSRLPEMYVNEQTIFFALF